MLIGKRLRRACLIGLLSVSIAYTLGVSALPAQENVTGIHHTLSVELIPTTHELAASDQIELQVEPQTTSVTFTLAHTLHVEGAGWRTGWSGHGPPASPTGSTGSRRTRG